MFKYLKLFIAIAFFTGIQDINACDICGCSMSSSAAILPQINKSIVGIRFSHSMFKSSHPSSLRNEFAGISTNDNFHTIEAIGRYNATERFHITAIVPFNYITQKSTQGNVQNFGLGDIMLMGQFLAVNPKLCTGKRAQHQFRAGLGLKFPTGSFNKKMNESLLHSNLQNGTGSLDILLSGIYTLRVDNWGLNTELSYRLNTANQNKFRFGNRAAAKLTAFYWWKLNENISILPTLGIGGEQMMGNRDGKRNVPYTGGWGVNAVAGFDVVMKKFVLSFSTQPPLIQHWSDGNVKRKIFLETALFYNF